MVSIQDKHFEPFIREDEIANQIKAIAANLNEEYRNKEVLFIAILNGAFVFAADLYREIELRSKISFIKVSSYEGMESTGQVEQLIGLTEEVQGKHIVIIEDIVDTGITIDKVKALIMEQNPASIEVCTLLFKPDAFEGKESPKFIGFSIPNKFVVGYGLDYDDYGRNLKEICQLKEGE